MDPVPVCASRGVPMYYAFEVETLQHGASKHVSKKLMRLISNTTMPFALMQLAKKFGKKDPDDFIARITGLFCNEFDIKEFVDDHDSTLSQLESEVVPLSKKNIRVTVRAKDPESVPSRKETQCDAFAVMLQAAKPKPVNFLPISAIDESASIQEQLGSGLESFCLDLHLGFKCSQSERQLKSNLFQIRDVLCFIEKHWKTLFLKDFPSLPNDETRQNRLLQLVADCSRIANQNQ
jgi:hypothetical protein